MKIEEFLDKVIAEGISDEDEPIETETKASEGKSPVMPESPYMQEEQQQNSSSKDTTADQTSAPLPPPPPPNQQSDKNSNEQEKKESAPEKSEQDTESEKQQKPKDVPADQQTKEQDKQQSTDPKQQLDQLLKTFEQHLQTGDITASMKAYAELKYASHKLMELGEQERKIFYERVRKADTLLGEKLKTVEDQAKQIISTIGQKVQQARTLPYKKALQEYTAASQLVDKIPAVATNFKQQAQALVLQLYIDLANQKAKHDEKKIAQAHAHIMDDIVKARHFVEAGQYDEAKKLYVQSLDEYRHLPAGYLQEKALLYKTVISLFNEISFSEKMHTLKHLLEKENEKSSHSNHGLLDAYVLRAKHHMKEGRLQQAKKDVGYVLQQDPHHERALELKNQLEPQQQQKTDLLMTKLKRLQYEITHGQKDLAIREITELHKQYPKNSKIALLKNKLESMQRPKKKVTS